MTSFEEQFPSLKNYTVEENICLAGHKMYCSNVIERCCLDTQIIKAAIIEAASKYKEKGDALNYLIETLGL